MPTTKIFLRPGWTINNEASHIFLFYSFNFLGSDLLNFTVLVGAGHLETDPVCSSYAGRSRSNAVFTLACPEMLIGKVVTVKALEVIAMTLCEVQVFGREGE